MTPSGPFFYAIIYYVINRRPPANSAEKISAIFWYLGGDSVKKLWLLMKSKIKIGSLLAIGFFVLTGGLLLAAKNTAAADWTYDEDFTTTNFENAAQTSADWNTNAGRVELTKSFPNWIQAEGNFYGGTIQDIAFSPSFAADNTVFVATIQGGIFRSTNGGTSWVSVSNNLPNLQLRAIAISPNFGTDNTLFVGTWGNTVYKSTDRGGSWSLSSTGLTNAYIYSLAISPSYATDNTIYAGTNGGGLFKSTDGGASWGAVNTGIGSLVVRSVVLPATYNDAGPNRNVFAGTWGAGVRRSINGGAAFFAINTGMTSTQIYDLALSPNIAADFTLYAGTNGGGINKSTNLGGGWADVTGAITNTDVRAVELSPNYQEGGADQTLWAGTLGNRVWRSTDAAGSFSFVGSSIGQTYIYDIKASPNYSSDHAVFTGTGHGGVYRSTNYGGSWSRSNSGLTALNFTDVAFSPNYWNDDTIFAATGNGILKSTNRGLTFSDATGNIGIRQIMALAISPNFANDNTIFAASFGGGVYRSTNGGSSWSQVVSGLSNTYLYDIVISPNYASDRTLFVGTNGAGVFRTQNAGGAWTQVQSGLPASSQIRALAISPNYNTDRVLFAGTETNGVYKTTNGHAACAWAFSGLAGLDVRALAISPFYDDSGGAPTAFAGTWGSGVYRTRNAGASWVARNSGIGSLYIQTFSISPRYPWDKTLFTGTNGAGVYQTSNAADLWTSANTNLTNLDVEALGISPTFQADSTLFSGTYGTSQLYQGHRYSGATEMAYSTTINSEARKIYQATITATGDLQTYGSLRFQVSANGGADWEPSPSLTLAQVASGYTHTFENRGNNLRWRVRFDSSNQRVSPLLENLTIQYSTDSTRPTSTVDTCGWFNAESWPGRVSGTASDPESGVNFVALAIQRRADKWFWNGSDWQEDTYWLGTIGTDNWYRPITPQVDRSFNLYSWAFDNAGNRQDTSQLGSCGMVYENTPPTTTASPPGGRYLEPQNVTLSVNEEATVYYSTNGQDPSPGAANTGSAQAPVTLGLAQDTDLRFFSIDRAGNRESVKREQYFIDTKAPTISLSVPGGEYQDTQQVTLTADEPATIYYTLDGSTPAIGGRSTRSGASPLTLTIATDTVLRYFAVDEAGNQSAIFTATYSIISENPQIELNKSASVSTASVPAKVIANFASRPRQTLAGNALLKLNEWIPLQSLPIAGRLFQPTTYLPALLVLIAFVFFFILLRTWLSQGSFTLALEYTGEKIIRWGKYVIHPRQPNYHLFSKIAPRDSRGTWLIPYSSFKRERKGFWTLLSLVLISVFIFSLFFLSQNLSYIEAQDGVAYPGSTLNYQISYLNTGEKTAEGVVITDSLPGSTTYLSGGDFNGGSVSWSVGDVDVDQGGSVSFSVQVNSDVGPGATIYNQAAAAYGPNGLSSSSNTTANHLRFGGQISGQLFNDENGNGKFDPLEGGVPRVLVGLYQDNLDSPLQTQISSSGGNFIFTGLAAGTYLVYIDPASLPAEYNLTAGANPTSISLASATDRANVIIGFGGPIGAVQQVANTLNEIRESPEVQAVNQGAAPVILPLTAINAIAAIAGTNSFLPYLSYIFQFFTEPFIYFGRKRKRKWGVIYDSLTGRPIDLAIVRLFDQETGKIVETHVTDSKGRYYFLPEENRNYKLTVTKPGFTFPSSIMAVLPPKEKKVKGLYFGETIRPQTESKIQEVKTKSAPAKVNIIAYNIPLDPAEGSVQLAQSNKLIKTDVKNLNQLLRELPEDKIEREDRKIIRQERLRKVYRSMAYVGPTFGLLSVIISPSIYTGILLLVHIILFLLFRRLAATRKTEPWGRVYDLRDNQSLAKAVVRLFDSRYGRLLMTKVTSGDGRYGFLVGEQRYILVSSKDGYVLPAGKLEVLGGREGIAKQDIGMKKVAGAPSDSSTTQDNETPQNPGDHSQN